MESLLWNSDVVVQCAIVHAYDIMWHILKSNSTLLATDLTRQHDESTAWMVFKNRRNRSKWSQMRP